MSTPQRQSRMNELRSRLRHLHRRLPRPGGRTSRSTAVARRPDGSAVSPSPVVSTESAGDSLVAQALAPLRGVLDALRDHWHDSIREAKLAAREKETEMRANYERRVHHDAHLHAQQRGRRGGSGQ